MRVRLTRGAGVTLLVLAALAGRAAAQRSTREAPLRHDLREEAAALFEAGVTAYGAGRYADALEHFERSYELSGHADLLFNIGLAAQKMGRTREAVKAFQRYLEQRPRAQDRAQVQARLHALRTSPSRTPDSAAAPESAGAPERDGSGTAADRGRETAPSLSAPAGDDGTAPGPTSASPSGTPAADGRADTPEAGPLAGRMWTWVTLGGAAVLGGLATYTWVDANRRFEGLRDECTPEGCTEERIRSEGISRRVTASRALLGLSLGAAVAAAVLFFFEDDGARAERRARVGVGPAGLTVRGSL